MCNKPKKFICKYYKQKVKSLQEAFDFAEEHNVYWKDVKFCQDTYPYEDTYVYFSCLEENKDYELHLREYLTDLPLYKERVLKRLEIADKEYDMQLKQCTKQLEEINKELEQFSISDIEKSKESN